MRSVVTHSEIVPLLHKSCLIQMTHPDCDEKSPGRWAIAIYKYLQTGIENKSIKSWIEHRKSRIMFCRCRVEKYACCMKRKLLLALPELTFF